MQGTGQVVRRTLLILWRTIGSVVRHLFWGTVQLPDFVWRRLFWERWLGYGEHPLRVLVVGVLILVSTWLLYWQVGTFVVDPEAKPPTVGQPTWQNALYYSVVSFTALGYGSWAPQPVGWARWFGSAESFLGIFSVVFFSISVTLRITR